MPEPFSLSPQKPSQHGHSYNLTPIEKSPSLMCDTPNMITCSSESTALIDCNHTNTITYSSKSTVIVITPHHPSFQGSERAKPHTSSTHTTTFTPLSQRSVCIVTFGAGAFAFVSFHERLKALFASVPSHTSPPAKWLADPHPAACTPKTTKG